MSEHRFFPIFLTESIPPFTKPPTVSENIQFSLWKSRARHYITPGVFFSPASGARNSRVNAWRTRLVPSRFQEPATFLLPCCAERAWHVFMRAAAIDPVDDEIPHFARYMFTTLPWQRINHDERVEGRWWRGRYMGWPKSSSWPPGRLSLAPLSPSFITRARIFLLRGRNQDFIDLSRASLFKGNINLAAEQVPGWIEVHTRR